MNKKYKYFVSITSRFGAINSFGHFEVERDAPITGIQDIKNIAKTIEINSNIKDVVVLFYRKFEEE